MKAPKAPPREEVAGRVLSLSPSTVYEVGEDVRGGKEWMRIFMYTPYVPGGRRRTQPGRRNFGPTCAEDHFCGGSTTPTPPPKIPANTQAISIVPDLFPRG